MTEKEKDNLLSKAKRDFPVGTKFFPAHLDYCNKMQSYCKITENTVICWRSGSIYALITRDNECGSIEGNFVSPDNNAYGNCSFERILYSAPDNRWAKIIKEPKQLTLKYASDDTWTPDQLEVINKARNNFKPGTRHYGHNSILKSRLRLDVDSTRSDYIEAIINNNVEPGYITQSYDKFRIINTKHDVVGGDTGCVYSPKERADIRFAITEDEVLNYNRSKARKLNKKIDFPRRYGTTGALDSAWYNMMAGQANRNPLAYWTIEPNKSEYPLTPLEAYKSMTSNDIGVVNVQLKPRKKQRKLSKY